LKKTNITNISQLILYALVFHYLLLSCASSGSDNQDGAEANSVLVCIADGVCNPDCQHDFDCNDDDVSEYNCEDTDGDGHNDYVFESCPQGDDYCSDDPNNWTLTGCDSCIDSDDDGYGENCNRGPDCDDEDNLIYENCPMVFLPAGCFEMGDSFSIDIHTNDEPVHSVCLSSFEIDIYETTNIQYAECVNASVCSPPFDLASDTRLSYFGNSTYDDFPVINVSWNDANTFCNWAGKRLLTEAEWEYAARGGMNGKYYPWGDDYPSCDIVNYGITCIEDTAAVGSYEANNFGLCDMVGNVEEWVNDWYNATYYSDLPDPVTNPTGPDNGDQRVLRGGSWATNPFLLHLFSRKDSDPTVSSSKAGFRCAR
jgi:formylglycine-generating enzyme required for sulfatase activity